MIVVTLVRACSSRWMLNREPLENSFNLETIDPKGPHEYPEARTERAYKVDPVKKGGTS
jgi:hypothetical protein